MEIQSKKDEPIVLANEEDAKFIIRTMFNLFSRDRKDGVPRESHIEGSFHEYLSKMGEGAAYSYAVRHLEGVLLTGGEKTASEHDIRTFRAEASCNISRRKFGDTPFGGGEKPDDSYRISRVWADAISDREGQHKLLAAAAKFFIRGGLADCSRLEP